MIADALAELAQIYLEEGRPLPQPDREAADAEADLIELLPLTVEAGASRS